MKNVIETIKAPEPKQKVSFEVKKRLWRAVNRYCLKEDITIREFIERLLENFFGYQEEIQVPPEYSSGDT